MLEVNEYRCNRYLEDGTRCHKMARGFSVYVHVDGVGGNASPNCQEHGEEVEAEYAEKGGTDKIGLVYFVPDWASVERLRLGKVAA